MGLNDSAAMQEGFSAGEDSVEFDTNLFAIPKAAGKGLKYFERPRDTPFSAGFIIRLGKVR
jgi:hypothetical protein